MPTEGSLRVFGLSASTSLGFLFLCCDLTPISCPFRLLCVRSLSVTRGNGQTSQRMLPLTPGCPGQDRAMMPTRRRPAGAAHMALWGPVSKTGTVRPPSGLTEVSARRAAEFSAVLLIHTATGQYFKAVCRFLPC